jgi:dTDP-glucose 4,6-dehydratase
LNKREWIHVSDHSKAVLMIAFAKILQHDIYNIGTGIEKTNIEIASLILKLTANTKSQIKFVDDRKGHDFRYALNCDRLKQEFSWSPEVNFEEMIEKTVRDFNFQ